jgi:hypothetical protein
MRVALITSWPPELCGIASNSVNVVNHRAEDVEYKIIEGCAWARPFRHEQVIRESADCDIVHLSYERNLHAGLGPQTFRELREMGKKLVITYHNVWPGDHQDDHMLECFDTVVSQDPKSPEERGFVYIPQGIMNVDTVADDKVAKKLGQAGFPTQFKGGHIMARVAQTLNLGVLMFAPTSIHADAQWMENAVRHHVPNAEVVRQFLPQEQIVKRLSECLVVVGLYATHSGQSGISGSIRLQLASKRPTVLSRCGMYRDLFGYEDELYFLDSDVPSFENVLPVVARAVEDAEAGKAKRPNRVVKDMDWWKAGRLYAEIYRKLMGKWTI